MTVREVMRTHFVTISQQATIGEAIDLMDVYQVTALPVVDSDGRVCGLLTETDLDSVMLSGPMTGAASECGAAFHSDGGDTPVSAIMNSAPVCVNEESALDEAAELMVAHGARRAPVLRTDGKITGVLSIIDLFAAAVDGRL